MPTKKIKSLIATGPHARSASKQIKTIVARLEGGKARLNGGNIDEVTAIFCELVCDPLILAYMLNRGFKIKARYKSKLK